MYRLIPDLTPSPENDLIRIGPARDGGYVVSENVSKTIDVLISTGVGEDVRFEMDFYEKFGSQGILVDPFVSQSVADQCSADLVLRKKLGPDKSLSSHESVSLTELVETAKKISGLERPQLCLKMDVEWDEWVVIEKTPSAVLCNFDQIILELHFIPVVPFLGPTLSSYFQSFQFLTQNKLNSQLAERYSQVIQKIANDFSCIQLHANNSLGIHSMFGEAVPYLLEATFVKKSLLQGEHIRQPQDPIRASLDFPNKNDRPELSGLYFQGRNG